MLETLVDIARRIRWSLYQLSSARLFGVDVDIVLHFGFGALIFAVAERRLGASRAAWLLAGVIVAKEIADLFLKSQLRYITRPTRAVVLDIVTDVATGVAGALAVWLVRRFVMRRRRAEEAV
jgi:hypothetical protein